MSGLFWADCIAVSLQDTDLGGRMLRYQMDVIARTAWGQSSTFVKIVKTCLSSLIASRSGASNPGGLSRVLRLTGL